LGFDPLLVKAPGGLTLQSVDRIYIAETRITVAIHKVRASQSTP